MASGDQFVADQGVKDEIIKNFDACAVEMEGAESHRLLTLTMFRSL